MENPRQKICRHRHCKKSFTGRRLNQAFCSVQCKSAENNWLAKLTRDKTKYQFQLQKTNEKILETFFLAGQVTVALSQLLSAGFSFEANCTFLDRSDNTGKLMRFFSFGIDRIDENTFQIVKVQ